MCKRGASTGNSAQHLEARFGQRPRCGILVHRERLPAQDNYDMNRTVMDLPVGPAHKALHQNFEEQPETACGLLTPWMDLLSGFVAPLALHLDAFSFFEEGAIFVPHVSALPKR